MRLKHGSDSDIAYTSYALQVGLGNWPTDTGPGGLVDADILEVCQFDSTVNHPGLTPSEGRLHFYVWAVLPSPLIISFDVRSIMNVSGGPDCLRMVSNPEIIAINQDRSVRGATLLRAGAVVPAPTNPDQVTFQVFGRPLTAPGTFAAVLLNRGAVAMPVFLSWSELGLANPGGAALVRDVGNYTDLGSFTGGFNATIPPHDAMIVLVTQ